jgi:hypothetical protein
MPCLLQVVSSEVVARYRVSEEKALAVHFPDSGPLMGMFCSTVAYLLSPENSHPCPWTVVQNEAGTPECLHRNVIEFSVSDFPGTVSLVDHFTHFELHVHTHPKKAARLWRLAHEAVFAGLRKAGKTIGYTNNTPVPAIVCPCSPTAPPHPATVSDGVWTCSKTTREFGDVAEDSIPWLSLCPSHTAESSASSHPACGTPSPLPSSSLSPPLTELPTPVSSVSLPPPSTTPPPTTTTATVAAGEGLDQVISDRDLAVIARDLLTEWENLRPFLELSRAQEKEVARSYPNQYGRQKRECLELWKEGKGAGATYRVFVAAAEEARDQELADSVRSMARK